MSDEDITLTAGDAEVTVQPGNGGRVGGLRIGGVELLRQGERFGCFPMVPWCGRIRDGRFLDGAVVRQMPLNAPPHAIHGTARDGAGAPPARARTRPSSPTSSSTPGPIRAASLRSSPSPRTR